MNATILVGLAVTLGAPALKGPPHPLVGLWTIETVGLNGKAFPDSNNLQWEFTADGKWLRYRGGNSLGGDKFRYTIDLTVRPYTIDMRTAGQDPKGVTMPGIFRIDGDKLTVSLAQGFGKARPTGFDVPKGMDAAVYTLRRAKKD